MSYDLRDMKHSQKTFIRQKIYSKSSDESDDTGSDRNSRERLLYAIHLQFSKFGNKLFLWRFRCVFSHRSEGSTRIVNVCPSPKYSYCDDGRNSGERSGAVEKGLDMDGLIDFGEV